MNLAEWFDLIAVLVALIAVGVAWDAKGKADRATRRSNELAVEANELNRRLVAIEETREQERKISLKKADLRCQIEPYNSSLNRLVIRNVGQGVASDVKVEVNGKPISEHSQFQFDKREDLELLKADIPQGGKVAMRVLKLNAHDSDSVSHAVLSWRNEDGTGGEHQTSI